MSQKFSPESLVQKKRYLKSIIFSVVCLLVIVVVNFFLPRLMPGDPVLMLVGTDEDFLTPEMYDYYYNLLGLDNPMPQQFADYLKALFSGEMGFSFHFNRNVGSVLHEKIPNTMQVALPAMVISALLALIFGTRTGFKRSKMLDNVLTPSAVAINAVPTFLVAMIMVLVFSYKLHWLPYGGLNSIITPEEPLLAFLDRLKHLILPVSALVIASTPAKYIMMRNTTASAMNEKYVLYAKARGVSSTKIRLKHIFRNICSPFVAMIGMSFGKILSGSIIIEMIFSIDGMGMLISQAISRRDFPILQGSLFIIAIMAIFANLITDFICILIDPRQRLGESNES